MSDEYITYRQAANLLNTSVDSIRMKASRGQIQVFRHPTQPAMRVVSRQEIEALAYGAVPVPEAEAPPPPPSVRYTSPDDSPPAEVAHQGAALVASVPMAPTLAEAITPEQQRAAYQMLVQAAYQAELTKALDHIAAEIETAEARLRNRRIAGYATRYTRYLESLQTPEAPRALPPPEV